MTNPQILMLIFAFLALTVGSFVWYVATWDATAEESLSFIWPNPSLPEAPAAYKGVLS